jgi:hypothetical protein
LRRQAALQRGDEALGDEIAILGKVHCARHIHPQARIECCHRGGVEHFGAKPER